MHKDIFKQAFRLFKANLYIGLISILGTALAISLIIVSVVGHNYHSEDYPPESNRHRTLYVKWVGVRDKENSRIHANGYLSLKTIKECFQTLETPEAVVVTSPLQPRLASVKETGKQEKCYVLFTDDVFWNVFDFKVLAGSPYTKAEFEAGIKKVILSKQMARNFFGAVDEAVGKQIQLSYVTYIVCAVVDDVLPLTDATFAQAWIPYTAANLGTNRDYEEMTGKYKCQIIARSSRDFKAIRQEVSNQINRYNASLVDYQAYFYDQPDDKFTESCRFGPGNPDMKGKRISYIVMISVLLLIPAINLSNFTMSRMKKRMGELGVRRAFGSTRMGLIIRVLSENMIYSFIGGMLGLLISYNLYWIKDMLSVSTNYAGMDIQGTLPTGVLINFKTFLAAFIFCLLLNLLSAFIPAWRVSSTPIVRSINEE